jgi:hypothetical protein
MSKISQLAKQAAYKQAIDPALLGAGLGGLLGGTGGYMLTPRGKTKDKNRNRLFNTLAGGLAGAGLGGAAGYLNRPVTSSAVPGFDYFKATNEDYLRNKLDKQKPVSQMNGRNIMHAGSGVVETPEELAVASRLAPGRNVSLASSVVDTPADLAKIKQLRRQFKEQQKPNLNASGRNIAPASSVVETPAELAIAKRFKQKLREEQKIEQGLQRVRNLPDVSFPKRITPPLPTQMTANPFEEGNAPISSYKDQARALGLGTELTRGPVAPKSTKANPFEIGNAQFTQDPRVLMQSFRPAIAQGLNQFLQNPRVANSMLPNARANIMQQVQPTVQLKPQQQQVSQPGFYDWLRSGRFLRSNGQGTGYGI